MSGVMRQPVLWPWLSLLIAALALSAVIVWQVRLPSLDLPKIRSRVLPNQAAGQPTGAEGRRVRLFLPQGTGGTLMEVGREIPRRPTLTEDIRATLRELGGGAPGARPPVAPGIEVRQVFLDAFGILYLDFSKGFYAAVTAPDPQPELSISALVTTLTTSFSEIKRVQFLIEGQEMPVVAGGYDLRGPIQSRFPGEAGFTGNSGVQE